MSGDRQTIPLADESSNSSSIPSDPRQRRICSLLLNRSHPMTVRDLCVQIIAQESCVAPSDVTEAEYQPVRIALYHRHLPKLEADGWVERHPEGVVAAEPLFSSDEDPLSPDMSDPDHPLWEAVGALLARPRRQELVSVIARQRDSLTLNDLATEVEHGDASWTTERRETEPTLVSNLHHIDLPKLAEVGLIEYDPEEKTVTATSRLLTMLQPD